MRSPLVVTLVACALAAAAPALGGAGKTTIYPSSVVVLDTATAAGFGSDPAHPFQNAPDNSWATGSNPAVKSVYSRILALNPGIKGHNVNLAERSDAGAELDDLEQVRTAIALKPKPQLVLVEVISRDLRCDGTTESDFAGYKAKFAAALGALSKGLPDARIFVISQWGSFASYANYLDSLDAGAHSKHAGKSPCQLIESPSMRVAPDRVAYAKRIVTGEEAQLAAVCAQLPHCRYDGGAAQRIAVSANDVDEFQFDPTIHGQAAFAAAEWAAISAFINST